MGWNIFINFLKNEFSLIKYKLTNNINNNILFKIKRTKFNVEKYNEKIFSYNIFINNKTLKISIG